MSRDYLNLNTYIADHRILIPDSILMSLICFETNDKIALKNTLLTLNNPQTLEQMNLSVINSFNNLFNFYIENENYIKTNEWEFLLLDLIKKVIKFAELKKALKELLKEYYIQNRRYKDALNLL